MSGKGSKTKAMGRPRKQRLVSYSSQVSQDSDKMGLRQNARKRKAVPKVAGVMIDSFFKEGERRGRSKRTGYQLNSDVFRRSGKAECN